MRKYVVVKLVSSILKIAHILRQGINGFFDSLDEERAHREKLGERSKEERKRIINDFRYYHQQQKHPSELSTVPKLVYHASKKITCSRSKNKYTRETNTKVCGINHSLHLWSFAIYNNKYNIHLKPTLGKFDLNLL